MVIQSQGREKAARLMTLSYKG